MASTERPIAGASANRIVLGIGGVTTGSSYVSRIAASTFWACFVRPSYIVGSTPMISSDELMNWRTSWIVSSSWPTPRWDSVSACSGISTCCAADSAPTVRMPSVGGQSIRIQS